VISNESLHYKIEAEIRELRADMKEMRAVFTEVSASIAERKAMRKAILCLLGGAGTGVAIVGIVLAIVATLR
jgi:hypothetical protein